MELDIGADALKATADAVEEGFKELRRKDEENREKGDITNIPPCIVCWHGKVFEKCLYCNS